MGSDTDDSTLPDRLFARYDLSVLFEQRTREAARLARPRNFTKVTGARILGAFDIEPLRLATEKCSAFTASQGSDRRTTFRIDFEGDAELWHLDPTDGELVDAPEGEVIRNSLVLTYFDADREALQFFREDMAKIEQLIALQSERIAEFLRDLPTKLRTLRGAQLH